MELESSGLFIGHLRETDIVLPLSVISLDDVAPGDRFASMRCSRYSRGGLFRIAQSQLWMLDSLDWNAKLLSFGQRMRAGDRAFAG
jgi:hypothetical protein